MKKIYKVMATKVTADWGRFDGYEEEYVLTDNIEAVVEAKKREIENVDCWWMEHGRGDDKRPEVTAEEIKVREA